MSPENYAATARVQITVLLIGCHNSFICDKNSTLSTAQALNENNAVYSDGLVQVNGVNYRALLDTGSGISYTLAGSSYALVISTERINKRPIRKV